MARSIFGKGSSTTTSGTNISKWDTVVTTIRARQYKRAIKGLYNATKATKGAYVSVAVEIVRKEVRELKTKQSGFQLSYDVDVPSIQDFSWDKTLSVANEHAPLFSGVLRACVTTRQNETLLIRGQRVQLKPTLVMPMAISLNARHLLTFNFLPTPISIQFWRGNLKQ